MPKLVRVVGILMLVFGGLVAATPVAADDPPIVTTVASQRVELMPPGQLCWNLFSTILAPGERTPASGFADPPLSVTYITDGEIRGSTPTGWAARCGLATAASLGRTSGSRA